MVNQQKQHFVPQRYLRNFSNTGASVSKYDRKRENYVHHASIRTEAQNPNFYGDRNVEQVITTLEAQLFQPVDLLISDPFSASHLEPEQRGALLACVIFQHLRTEQSGIEANQLNDYFAKLELYTTLTEKNIDPESVRIGMRNPALLPMTHLSKAIEHTLDLDYFLFVNETDVDFVTSDCPVAVNNSWNMHTKFYPYYQSSEAFACHGLQLIYPLSPRLLLCFYDPQCYKFGARRSNLGWLDQRIDVERFNYLQVFKAADNLYFQSNSRIGSLLRFCLDLRRAQRPKIKFLQAENETTPGDFISMNYMPSRSLAIRVAGVRHRNLAADRAEAKQAKLESLMLKATGDKYVFRGTQSGIRNAYDMVNKIAGTEKN